MPKPDMPREAMLVDRRHDKALAEMHAEASDAVARAESSSGGGEASLARYQALANVVAGHMGGALVRPMRRRRLPPLGCCCRACWGAAGHAGVCMCVFISVCGMIV